LSAFTAPSISWGQSSVEKEIELEFWRAVKDSNDPTMVNAYLQKYPDGDFAILANIKIQKLEQAAEEPVAQPKTATSAKVATFELDADDGDVDVEGLTVDRTGVGEADEPVLIKAMTDIEISASDSSTTDDNSGCPAGTKQTYKGCEADSDALAVAAEAALKAVELSQSANTEEEKVAAKTAAEQAAQQLQVMKAAAEEKKAERKAALKVRAKADNKKALAVVIKVNKVRVEAVTEVAKAKKSLAKAGTREEKKAAQALVDAAQSLAEIKNPTDLLEAQKLVSEARVTLKDVEKEAELAARTPKRKGKLASKDLADAKKAVRSATTPEEKTAAEEEVAEVADSGGDSGGGGSSSSGSSTTATQSNSGGGNSGADEAAARSRAIAIKIITTRIQQSYNARGLVNSSMANQAINAAIAQLK
jgi:hypothetical protein